MVSGPGRRRRRRRLADPPEELLRMGAGLLATPSTISSMGLRPARASRRQPWRSPRSRRGLASTASACGQGTKGAEQHAALKIGKTT